MIPADIIARKRDGESLSEQAITQFVAGFVDGTVADYQMSALAMAVVLRGMSQGETVALTQAMLASGDRLSWSTDRPTVDKHSTGGQGDKTSLVLAPLLACCDVQVPMISGRGLGATGGTLDKLESIPGFRTQLSLDQIRSQVEEIGCVIAGATDRIAPADQRLYALRDVTATVESIPLITASILAKKLAESLDRLVLDVKFGSGAFMMDLNRARDLAVSLVSVANQLGMRTSALLTNMDQPLGRGVGNAVEVYEAIEVLKGEGPVDVRELSCALGAELLVGAGIETSVDAALRRLEKQLDEGAAFERFERMVTWQGGRLPAVAPAVATELTSDRDGCVVSIDGRALGQIVVEIGGGRRQVHDDIDPTVGLEMLVRLGDHVSLQQPLVRILAKPCAAERVLPRVQSAIGIDPSRHDFPRPNLIADTIPTPGESRAGS